MTEERLVCFICADEGYCQYPVCYEQEITERMKQEEEAQGDLFNDEEE